MCRFLQMWRVNLYLCRTVYVASFSFSPAWVCIELLTPASSQVSWAYLGASAVLWLSSDQTRTFVTSLFNFLWSSITEILSLVEGWWDREFVQPVPILNFRVPKLLLKPKMNNTFQGHIPQLLDCFDIFQNCSQRKKKKAQGETEQNDPDQYRVRNLSRCWLGRAPCLDAYPSHLASCRMGLMTLSS